MLRLAIAYAIFSLCIIMGCDPKEALITNSEPLFENTITVDSKINGGNILSSFRLTGLDAMVFDMPAQTNANWVAISPVIPIEKKTNGTFTFDTKKAANISKIITNIKDKGVTNYMLKPLISFEKLGYDFWGDYIAASEEEWLQVETAFEKLLFAYADTSLNNPEVKILCMGNELFNFSKARPNFFRRVAKLLKTNYPELKLTYAANWNEYEHIQFWDVLDYIGINPYFPLVNTPTPTVEELEQAYAPIKIKLSNLSTTYKKPMLFTEYGFRSIDYAAWKGWELPDFIQNQSAYNPEAQSNGYTAFYNTFWKEKWVAGGFFWVWEVLSGFDSIHNQTTYLNSDWSVNYKPVTEIIKSNYTSN